MATVFLDCINPRESPDSPGVEFAVVGDPLTAYKDGSDATYSRADFIDAGNGTTAADVVPLSASTTVLGVGVSMRIDIAPTTGTAAELALSLGDAIEDVPDVHYGLGDFEWRFGGDAAALEALAAELVGGTLVRLTPSNVGFGGSFTVYELRVFVEVAADDEGVVGHPPRRIFPRDDGLTGGAPRVFPASKGLQSGNRTVGGYL